MTTPTFHLCNDRPTGPGDLRATDADATWAMASCLKLGQIIHYYGDLLERYVYRNQHRITGILSRWKWRATRTYPANTSLPH